MRKGLLAFALALFAVFLVWKVVPFLQLARPDIASTPTVTPQDPALLSPVIAKGRQRVCLASVALPPNAHYVEVTVDTKRPTKPITVEASAPGYRAIGQIPAGQVSTTVARARITPPPRELQGSLCLTHRSRHRLAYFGVNPGAREGAPLRTTIDGRRSPAQLSVTLLSSPSRSLWGQLGSIFHRVAVFRPITSWMAALLFGVLLLAVPAALAVAVARADALDDEDDRDQESARP